MQQKKYQITSQQEYKQWMKGFPNYDLNCYFNSFNQLYLQCNELFPWDEPASEFHSKVLQLKSIDEKYFQSHLQELNQTLTYQNQDNHQGNDPIRVLSAVITNTLKDFPKIEGIPEPKRLQEEYLDYASSNSNTSFQFQLVIYEGNWCNVCQNGDSINENTYYFLTLKGKIEHSNSVQEKIDDLLKINRVKPVTCVCGSEREQIKGFIKCPNFLYINMNEEQKDQIKINKEIKIKNETETEPEQQLITYELKGIISHPPAHYTYYRKENEEKWTHFDDDYISDVKIPRFTKGLLYLSTKKTLLPSQQINTPPSLSNKHKILKLLSLLNEQQNKMLAADVTTYGFFIQGQNKEGKNIMIRVFNIEKDDLRKYEEKENKIQNILKNITIHEKSQFFEETCQYVVVNCTDSLVHLDQYLKQNKQESEESRRTFFISILEIVKEIESQGMSCPPIQLDNIWKKSDKWGILSMELFANNNSDQKYSTELLKDVLIKLFKDTKQTQIYQQLLQIFESKKNKGQLKIDDILIRAKSFLITPTSPSQQNNLFIGVVNNPEDNKKKQQQLIMKNEEELQSQINKLISSYEIKYSCKFVIEKKDETITLKGKSTTNNLEVIIKMFNNVSESDQQIYDQLVKKIAQIKQSVVLPIISKYSQLTKQYVMIYTHKHQSLEQLIHKNDKTITNELRKTIFEKMVELLKNIEENDLSCSSIQQIQLKDILLKSNLINPVELLSHYLFTQLFTEQKGQQVIEIDSWLRNFTEQLFPKMNELTPEQSKILEQLLSCLSVNGNNLKEIIFQIQNNFQKLFLVDKDQKGLLKKVTSQQQGENQEIKPSSQSQRTKLSFSNVTTNTPQDSKSNEKLDTNQNSTTATERKSEEQKIEQITQNEIIYSNIISPQINDQVIPKQNVNPLLQNEGNENPSQINQANSNSAYDENNNKGEQIATQMKIQDAINEIKLISTKSIENQQKEDNVSSQDSDKKFQNEDQTTSQIISIQPEKIISIIQNNNEMKQEQLNQKSIEEHNNSTNGNQDTINESGNSDQPIQQIKNDNLISSTSQKNRDTTHQKPKNQFSDKQKLDNKERKDQATIQDNKEGKGQVPVEDTKDGKGQVTVEDNKEGKGQVPAEDTKEEKDEETVGKTENKKDLSQIQQDQKQNSQTHNKEAEFKVSKEQSQEVQNLEGSTSDINDNEDLKDGKEMIESKESKEQNQQNRGSERVPSNAKGEDEGNNSLDTKSDLHKSGDSLTTENSNSSNEKKDITVTDNFKKEIQRVDINRNDTIQVLKNQIKVDYLFFLLDKNNTKLEDEQTFKDCSINVSTQLMAFEITEKHKGKYQIQCKSKNVWNCQKIHYLELKGTETIKEIKEIVFKKIFINQSKQDIRTAKFQKDPLNDNQVICLCEILNKTIYLEY